MITPGKNPKLTISAKESRSFPIGDFTFNKRATIPSKKSKIPEKITKYAAVSKLPLNAKTIPIQPEKRFAQVIALGRCFFIGLEGWKAGRLEGCWENPYTLNLPALNLNLAVHRN